MPRVDYWTSALPWPERDCFVALHFFYLPYRWTWADFERRWTL